MMFCEFGHTGSYYAVYPMCYDVVRSLMFCCESLLFIVVMVLVTSDIYIKFACVFITNKFNGFFFFTNSYDILCHRYAHLVGCISVQL